MTPATMTLLEQTSTTLFAPGTVAEMRILNTPRDGTVSGYFDSPQPFVKAAAAWSGKAPAVYCTLNPCTPALLARAANRLKTRVKTTTADHDIVRRVWLPLDFDPVRPADISSTDVEHATALERTAACTTWLRERGWPQPVRADSGNGGHALYQIDLPNDDASRTLLKTCLEVLALYFTDGAVSLDVSVFNAARIWKCYGTMACKGDNVPERPHRLAHILDVPPTLSCVTRDQLDALAALLPAPPTTTPKRGTTHDAFDLRQWIATHGLSVAKEGVWQQTGYRWELNPCPWNSAHTNGAAFVVQFASGAIAAGCHHNGCQGNDWHALRDLYEPGWQTRRVTVNGTTQQAGAEPTAHNGTQPQGGPALTPRNVADTLFTDTFNAMAFVADHGKNLRYCYPWKTWLVWTGTHWQRDTSGEVMRLAKHTIKHLARRVEAMDDAKQIAMFLAHIKSSLSTVKLRALLENAQSEAGIAVQPQDLDTHVWLLNCTNGTIDLTTGKKRDHDPKDMLTKCLPVPYDPNARCPKWLAFLEKAMQGSAEMIKYLQRTTGYTLTGSTREQCLFLCHGPTKTGKSTYLALLRALLAAYGKQTDISTFLHKDRPEVRNDLADLAGARYVYAVESQEGKRLAEGLVKQMTGGVDGMKARFLYEELFEFQPQFKAYIGTNHLPTIKDADDAIWERIRRIPFVVQIPKEDRDKDLEAKLKEELPGIVAWAVRGCLEWQKLGDLQEPPQVVDATQEYRSEMDTVARFLEECCRFHADFRIKAGDLHKAFLTWCEGTGRPSLSLKELGSRLEKKGFEKHTSNFVWRLGLALKDN